VSPRTIAAIVLLLLAIGAGVWLGRQTMPRLVPEDVTPQPAQSLPGNAVMLERKPVPTVNPRPIKPGTTVERAIAVTVQPDQPECEPVTVDLQLVQDGAGRRVVASSPDGVIVGGLDVPVRQIVFDESLRWAAGVSCEPADCQRTPGIWVDRDFDRVRVGAEVSMQPDGEPRVEARVGWRW
jgi:hypothetical protein